MRQIMFFSSFFVTRMKDTVRARERKEKQEEAEEELEKRRRDGR